MADFADSTDKIQGYLRHLSSATVPVVLSPLFFRDFTCPLKCGACCTKFTLDYVEGTERWERFKQLYPHHLPRYQPRRVRGATVWTDAQEDNKTNRCRNLNLENGRCAVHEANPFTCEFEVMKVWHEPTKQRTLLTARLFTRGWKMRRVTGELGTLCEMLPYDTQKTERDIKMLQELQTMATLMHYPTVVLQRLIATVKKCREYLNRGLRLTKNIQV